MKAFPALLIFCCTLIATAIEPVQAQEQDEQAVITVIEQLFDGMRASDSTMAGGAFTSDALMQTIVENEAGEVEIRTGKLEAFLNAVGSPKELIWDEKILDYVIKIDGKLATAWTPYEFYRGEEFSHCGVNAFQLINNDKGWQIFAIVDTRRTTNCPQ
ncbi:nuclear transport factor 2 family protein [Gracilimonas mengyeensis]|nr:nuclear transport factor 2 family protein [Gracilimonas mengyeensis]